MFGQFWILQHAKGEKVLLLRFIVIIWRISNFEENLLYLSIVIKEYKLQSYSLSCASKKIIGKKKINLSYKEVFDLCEKGDKRVYRDYC